MEESPVIPLYVKISLIIIGILAFFFILYVGQDIIVPLVFATLISILLNPVLNWLEHKGTNRILAIAITLLGAMILIAALIYFISFQIAGFSETFPQLKLKLSALLKDVEQWISHTLNISNQKVEAWISTNKKEALTKSSALIGQTLSAISSLFVMLFLLPVYIFMILFYKPLLLGFISQLSPKGKLATVAEVLEESKLLIQNYLTGLMIELAIVATLNSVALLILGIEYAILLGLIGAILNLIPYIGGLVAIALPMTIALATKSPFYALLVFVAYILVQFIDNNFLVPKIVASKVKINALASIVVVLVGGAMWGIAGMFLSLPLIAILKVIFDRIEPLKPIGFLLGDTLPPTDKSVFSNKTVKSKFLKK